MDTSSYGLVFIETLDHESQVLRWLTRSPYNYIGVYFEVENRNKFVTVDVCNYRGKSFISEVNSFQELMNLPLVERVSIRRFIQPKWAKNKSLKDVFDLKVAQKLFDMIKFNTDAPLEDCFNNKYPNTGGSKLLKEIVESVVQSVNSWGFKKVTIEGDSPNNFHCEILGDIKIIECNSYPNGRKEKFYELEKKYNEYGLTKIPTRNSLRLIESLITHLKRECQKNSNLLDNVISDIVRSPSKDSVDKLGEAFNNLVESVNNPGNIEGICSSFTKLGEEINNTQKYYGYPITQTKFFCKNRFGGRRRDKTDDYSMQDPRRSIMKAYESIEHVRESETLGGVVSVPINIFTDLVNIVSKVYGMDICCRHINPQAPNIGRPELDYSCDNDKMTIKLNVSERDIKLGLDGTPIPRLTPLEAKEILEILTNTHYSFPGMERYKNELEHFFD